MSSNTIFSVSVTRHHVCMLLACFFSKELQFWIKIWSPFLQEQTCSTEMIRTNGCFQRCKVCEICWRTVESLNRMHRFMNGFSVLKWLRSEKDLSVFVRNRVKEINIHGDITFHYITSRENPADIASCGTDIYNLSGNQLWWHGPVWLKETEKKWPTSVSNI